MFKFFKNNEIGNPPWDYYFLKNLDEKEYPLYLAKCFKINTGEKLPLEWSFRNGTWRINKKKCKTFNQKIQWIKLYGITDLMRKCTDKVAVRDYVAEKIGEEYLKPVLQIIPSLNCDCHVIARNNSTLGDEAIQRKRSQLAMNEDKQLKSGPDCHVAIAPRNDRQFNDVSTYFDQIDFDKLPNSFVIKCNHGCKWHFIIKNKEEFLKNKRLFEITKYKITNWLEQDYSFWGGFEMQYRVKSADRHCGQVDFNLEPACQSAAEKYNQPDCHVTQNAVVPRNDKYIEPKILIEPFIPEKRLIEVYCFGSIPKIFADVHLTKEVHICTYNEDFSYSDLILKPGDKLLMQKIFPDEPLKKAVELSGELSKDFKFVRVDWMIYENRLYFEELTFTPYSGFTGFNKNWNFKIGNLINLQ